MYTSAVSNRVPFPNVTAFALAFLAAAPALADKKRDEAVAKAEAQLAKGKDDEAVKILQKAAARSRPSGSPSEISRIRERSVRRLAGGKDAMSLDVA